MGSSEDTPVATLSVSVEFKEFIGSEMHAIVVNSFCVCGDTPKMDPDVHVYCVCASSEIGDDWDVQGCIQSAMDCEPNGSVSAEVDFDTEMIYVQWITPDPEVLHAAKRIDDAVAKYNLTTHGEKAVICSDDWERTYVADPVVMYTYIMRPRTHDDIKAIQDEHVCLVQDPGSPGMMYMYVPFNCHSVIEMSENANCMFTDCEPVDLYVNL